MATARLAAVSPEDDRQSLKDSMLEAGRKARQAARSLALAPADAKNGALVTMAAMLRNFAAAILEANAVDVEAAEAAGKTGAFVDRLTLNTSRVDAMARGLEEIAALTDPVGDVIAEWTRPNGLRIERVRVPLGVVGMIFESRPNVLADAGGLCLKSGNAVILRGGSDALNSYRAIHNALVAGLRQAGLAEEAVQLVDSAGPRGGGHDARRARRQHRCDRTAGREEPRRARAGGGAGAGVRASGRRQPCLRA